MVMHTGVNSSDPMLEGRGYGLEWSHDLRSLAQVLLEESEHCTLLEALGGSLMEIRQ